jgi:hypothetical protein
MHKVYASNSKTHTPLKARTPIKGHESSAMSQKDVATVYRLINWLLLVNCQIN